MGHGGYLAGPEMNASRLALFVTTIGMALPSADAAGSWKGLESPSGKFRIEFSRGPQGSPLYRVLWKKKAMIEPSGMGFVEAGGVDWRKGFSQLKLGKVTEQKNSSSIPNNKRAVSFATCSS